MHQYIKDSKGQLIGKIDERNGDTWAYDKYGHLTGRFQKSNNQTVDAAGHRVGLGNQVLRTIKPFNEQH